MEYFLLFDIISGLIISIVLPLFILYWVYEFSAALERIADELERAVPVKKQKTSPVKNIQVSVSPQPASIRLAGYRRARPRRREFGFRHWRTR